MSVRIAAIREQSFAGLIVSQLKDAGLNPFEINTSAHVSIGGAEQYYYITVLDEEVDEGRRVLSDLGFKEYLM